MASLFWKRNFLLSVWSIRENFYLRSGFQVKTLTLLISFTCGVFTLLYAETNRVLLEYCVGSRWVRGFEALLLSCHTGGWFLPLSFWSVFFFSWRCLWGVCWCCAFICCLVVYFFCLFFFVLLSTLLDSGGMYFWYLFVLWIFCPFFYVYINILYNCY
jgi:hypothetical protein